MELQLEDSEANAGEEELAAEIAAKASTVKAFERERPISWGSNRFHHIQN